ncbi:STAS domain-containing protein [Amycolatopsis sp. NBRC 101858]|uniref:STAS domain-containing protein n=1 Tax=Amycolatopsis sp. NBRC 101858 TaxID=3032200 RepID=UPI002553C9B7|nr:STAS domain-containing protein [Amycolatopsis sp. NBRC 101858]
MTTAGSRASMARRLQLSSRAEGNVAVLTAVGEVDWTTAESLADAAETLLITQGAVVLDLAGVSHLNAEGLGALLRVRRHAERVRGRLVLAMVPAAVVRRLKRTGLGSAFMTATSTEAGIVALSS